MANLSIFRAEIKLVRMNRGFRVQMLAILTYVILTQRSLIWPLWKSIAIFKFQLM